MSYLDRRNSHKSLDSIPFWRHPSRNERTLTWETSKIPYTDETKFPHTPRETISLHVRLR